MSAKKWCSILSVSKPDKSSKRRSLDCSVYFTDKMSDKISLISTISTISNHNGDGFD